MYGFRPQRRCLILRITAAVFFLPLLFADRGLAARDIILPDIVLPGYFRDDLPMPEDFAEVGLNWVPSRPRMRRVYAFKLERRQAAWEPVVIERLGTPEGNERKQGKDASISAPPRRGRNRRYSAHASRPIIVYMKWSRQ